MKPESKITPINVEEETSAAPLVRFLENKKLLINIFSSLIIATLLISLIVRSSNKSMARQTSVAYSSIDDQGSLLPNSELKQISKIAGKYNHLRAHLDAPLAQEYLNVKSFKEAHKVNERMHARLNPYMDLSFKLNDLTFLISQENYSKALDLAIELRPKINPQTMPTLYSYHLLRLAFLYQKLDQQDLSEKTRAEFLTLNEATADENPMQLGYLSVSKFLAQR